jgi:hypothetical protein
MENLPGTPESERTFMLKCAEAMKVNWEEKLEEIIDSILAAGNIDPVLV